ncbi:MAG: PQQ-binding-like beta-propeller repeat protein [Proteobacteria bacterium]|nr:PQQ-binding-like beta-propeller repeat protein [Pseudomonadota bacterium]
MKKFAVFFCAALLLFSCKDKDKDYDKTKALSVFAVIDTVKIDESLNKVEINLPAQKNIPFWSGSSSAQNQLAENFSKDFSLKNRGFFFDKTKEISLSKNSPIWFFYSGEVREHFVFSPIIKDGKVFTLDSAGALSSYDLSNEKRIWKSQIFKKSFLKNYRTPRISFADGKIFAIAGVNQIAAASEIDGKVLWSKTISSIPISTPISDGKLVYVSSNDNKLYALKIENGELAWIQSGISRATAIFGSADPVIYDDQVIVSYSSGEIYALKKQTGEAIWSQDLNLSKATSSDFYLNDIDATPLVKDGVVYAIGNGGLTAAIRIKDGSFLWKKQIAGIVDFWAAGEFLFIIDNSDKLLAVSRKTGGIKWISQLPELKKPNKPQTKIFYSGLVMAGDKLLIARADGQLLIASPFDGKVEKTFKIDKKISHSPVVVNGKIYLHSIGKYTIDLIEIQ